VNHGLETSSLSVAKKGKHKRQVREVAMGKQSLQRNLYKTRNKIQNVKKNKTTGTTDNIGSHTPLCVEPLGG